jgi:hypothetical protein
LTDKGIKAGSGRIRSAISGNTIGRLKNIEFEPEAATQMIIDLQVVG